MADEAMVQEVGALKTQTNEVGHMNAAKKQSNGPLRSRPLRGGPVRRGTMRGPIGSGTMRGCGTTRGSGTVRGPVRSRKPTVVGINKFVTKPQSQTHGGGA